MKTINTLPIPWLKAIKEYIKDNSSDYSKARLRIYTRMPKFNNDKPYPLPTATLDKVLKHKRDAMRNPNGTFRIPRTYTIELDTFEKNTFNINIITTMAYLHTKLKNNLIKAGFNMGSWKVDYIHHVPEGTYAHIQCRIPDLTTGNLIFISSIIKDTFYTAAANAHKLSIRDLVNLSLHQWNGYLYIETYFNYRDEPLLAILYNQSNGILSIEKYPNRLTPEDQDEPK